jgi:hypothetical protein
MKKLFLLLLISTISHALGDLVYFGSILNDNNKKLAQAFIEGISADKDKQTAKALFKGKFKEDYKPAAQNGLSVEDKQKLIASASKDLQEQLKGKDLSNPNDLQTVLQYIGGPNGSGGKLAKQIGPKQTLVLSEALVKSS